MSFWGKTIGAAAGLALGGPLGALIGAVAGHAVDVFLLGEQAAPDGQQGETEADLPDGGRTGLPTAPPLPDPTRRVAFTIAVVALSAKIAKADGKVTDDEIAMFNRLVRVEPEEERNLRYVFDLARRGSYGYESYAKQIRRLLDRNPAVLEELLGLLFLIATADGRVHRDEETFLADVARIFGFSRTDYDRIRAQHVAGDVPIDDPWMILGLPPDTEPDRLKSEYRRLVRENHPDRLVADGLPEEFIAIANAKLARITAAYARIQKQRSPS